MGNVISVDLLHDLPENWNDTQYVSPNGTEVGLTRQHGYNYLMQQVNTAQRAAAELDDAFAYISGHNVLDNWYFRDIVDTKNAYYVEEGMEYYRDTTFSDVWGVTLMSYVAHTVTSEYIVINIDGLGDAYVPISDARHGYTIKTPGAFNFNRWWGYMCDVTQTRSGVIVSSSSTNSDAIYRQPIVDPWRFAGQVVTVSILCSSVSAGCKLSLYKSSSVDSSNVLITTKPLTVGINTVTVTLPSDVGSSALPFLHFNIDVPYNGYITMTAAKFELGRRQTLAHDNGTTWVLNEIPNKTIELVKCNGAPINIGGEGRITTAEALGLSTANTLAEVEVV